MTKPSTVGYDTSVIGGTMALDSFRRDFHLVNVTKTARDTLQGNIVSTFQAGCFFGALLTFPLAEKIGRKKAIMYSSLVFLAGGTLMTASHGVIGMLIAGRAIAGLGIGAVSLIVPVYIAETSPPSIRGRLIGIFEIASQGGGMCGFWVSPCPIGQFSLVLTSQDQLRCRPYHSTQHSDPVDRPTRPSTLARCPALSRHHDLPRVTKMARKEGSLGGCSESPDQHPKATR